jgi:FMN phosphatase YigB (HAD superfamily)
MSSLALKAVKHAVFDAYGTLFDVHSAASRHRMFNSFQSE